MVNKVSDLIAWGIHSGKYHRSIQTCPCPDCKDQKKIVFTTWISGMAYKLCPLEVALLEQTGDPLPWSESPNVLGLPQGIIDQVVHRANTKADDCIQFLRMQGY